jgi:hypothetical protein
MWMMWTWRELGICDRPLNQNFKPGTQSVGDQCCQALATEADPKAILYSLRNQLPIVSSPALKHWSRLLALGN